MAELKKCPFCGSVADLHQNQAGMFVVRCVKFGCWVSTMPCDFEETAIIKWNTRPTTTESEIRAKAIDEFAKEIEAEYDNDACPNVTDYLDYKISLRDLFRIAEQLKEE